MIKSTRKTQVNGRVCFVCNGTGFLPNEQRRLRSIQDIDAMHNTSRRSAPKTDETPLEELSKIERHRIRLEKQKNALLKTVERLYKQQNILEQKKIRALAIEKEPTLIV